MTLVTIGLIASGLTGCSDVAKPSVGLIDLTGVYTAATFVKAHTLSGGYIDSGDVTTRIQIRDGNGSPNMVFDSIVWKNKDVSGYRSLVGLEGSKSGFDLSISINLGFGCQNVTLQGKAFADRLEMLAGTAEYRCVLRDAVKISWEAFSFSRQ